MESIHCLYTAYFVIFHVVMVVVVVVVVVVVIVIATCLLAPLAYGPSGDCRWAIVEVLILMKRKSG